MHPRERLRLKSIISTTCSFITFSTIVYKMGGFEGNEGKRFGVDCAPTNRLVVGVVNFLDRKHGKTYRQILYICPRKSNNCNYE